MLLRDRTLEVALLDAVTIPEQPLRPGEPAIATAELASNRRNRIFEAKAELRDRAGNVLATVSESICPSGPRSSLNS
jgi:hypothetical protein